jgi:hypothetical protein
MSCGAVDGVDTGGDLYWLLGAGLSIFGSVGSNLGVNTQKWAFMQNDKLRKADRKKYTELKAWWIGLFLIIGGSLGDFAALGLAAQSIVAPGWVKD